MGHPGPDLLLSPATFESHMRGTRAYIGGLLYLVPMRRKCRWCRRDAITPNLLYWKGIPYHHKCAMQVAERDASRERANLKILL